MTTPAYVRPPFDEARAQFLAFLTSQGWPTVVRWVSRDRLAGYRRTRLVFRPAELDAPAFERAAKEFYEQLRATSTSIRVDALGVHDGRTLAYVQDYGGERASLNFGVPTDGPPLMAITSRARWVGMRALASLLGGSPFLRSVRLTPRALRD